MNNNEMIDELGRLILQHCTIEENHQRDWDILKVELMCLKQKIEGEIAHRLRDQEDIEMERERLGLSSA